MRPFLKIAVLCLIISLSACQTTAATPEPTDSTELSPEMLEEQIKTWEAANASLEAPTLPPSATPTISTTPALANIPVTASSTPSPDDWQQAPIVPQHISQRVIEIYEAGQAVGRNPQAYSKVGDCGGTPSWFLGAFDLDPTKGYYALGSYQHLDEVIGYYQKSHERYSMAVSPGFNTSSIFSPLWADPAQCEQNESPLQCEFRLHNPSVALIMLGTNDYLKPEEFEQPMREIIEYTIDQGIIPILASKPDNLERDHSINRTIYQLSLEYELPFWNLWAATNSLSNQGLQGDGAHLRWAPNFFDDPQVMEYGWPWRNLTALQALDAVWQALPQ